jgi:hypothetical protein
MASTSAISATTQAVIRLLRSAYDPLEFNNAQLDFEVYVASDFLTPMDEGVSLLLYRIYHDGSPRTPPGRRAQPNGAYPNGQLGRTKLPLELHFMLTAWAKQATLQHEIAGWMMRTMEDNPIYYPSLLNSYKPGVFYPEETVSLSLAQLSVEDMFNIWDVMIHHVYQLSVPYVARVVELESPLSLAQGAPIQQRIVNLRNPVIAQS